VMLENKGHRVSATVVTNAARLIESLHRTPFASTNLDVSLDLEHKPADLAEAIEMLRRAKPTAVER
jgi:hypothetical protein